VAVGVDAAKASAELKLTGIVSTPPCDQMKTNSIRIANIVAEFLNNVGVGNSTTIAALKKHVKNKLGYLPDHVDRWIDQQCGGKPIGGIEIKNPKYTLDTSGTITVHKLHVQRPKKNH
jgi:hypothetical protein